MTNQDHGYIDIDNQKNQNFDLNKVFDQNKIIFDNNLQD